MRFLTVVVLVACGGDDGSVTDAEDSGGDTPTIPGDEEPDALAGMTAAHNRVRDSVGVGPMRWNDELEALAGRFVLDCQFAHSSQAERSNVAGFGYVGENLFLSGFVPSADDVANAWASEEAFYNYPSNSCTSVCGHYTQMVWESSVDLGCAVKECPNGYLVACEYGPGGNFAGERPY